MNKTNPFKHPSVTKNSNGTKTISAHSIDTAVTYDYVKFRNVHLVGPEHSNVYRNEGKLVPRAVIENLQDQTRIEIIKDGKDLYVIDTETLKDKKTTNTIETETTQVTEGVFYEQKTVPNKTLRLVNTKNHKHTNLEDLTGQTLNDKEFRGMVKTYKELYNMVVNTYKKHI